MFICRTVIAKRTLWVLSLWCVSLWQVECTVVRPCHIRHLCIRNRHFLTHCGVELQQRNTWRSHILERYNSLCIALDVLLKDRSTIFSSPVEYNTHMAVYTMHMYMHSEVHLNLRWDQIPSLCVYRQRFLAKTWKNVNYPLKAPTFRHIMVRPSINMCSVSGHIIWIITSDPWVFAFTPAIKMPSCFSQLCPQCDRILICKLAGRSWQICQQTNCWTSLISKSLLLLLVVFALCRKRWS